MVGVSLFQRVLSGWDFRPVFWVTTVIRAAASLADIAIVLRLNLAIGACRMRGDSKSISTTQIETRVVFTTL